MKKVEPLIAMELPAEPHSAKVARDAIAGLDGHLGNVFGDVVLLISELVTNSVRHAGLAAHEVVRVRASEAGEVLHLEVEDTGCSGVPHRRIPDGVHGGLGLNLVDAISLHWGVQCNDHTMVWADLPISAGRLPAPR